MAEEVLDGLKGVETVNSDYRNFDEMTIAWYDPAVISVGEMETALKEAGTYLGTVAVGETQE